MRGLAEVIECRAAALDASGWWTAAVRAEAARFRSRLRRSRYDAVIDLQGLTKSALIAARWRTAPSYGLANRTDGASHEWPARWLVDHAIRIEPRIHALDRSRELAARALGYAVDGPPRFGLRARGRAVRAPTRRPWSSCTARSRDDKLWPEADWIELGHARDRRTAGASRCRRPARSSWRAPSASPRRSAPACAVWPAMDLDALVDRMAATQGVIGVDSGLSHIAVALEPAARAALQLPDRLAHRAAAGARPSPPGLGRSASRRRRRRRGLGRLAAGAAAMRRHEPLARSAGARGAYSALLRRC